MAKMTAEFHIAFNVVLAAVFIGLLDPLSWLLERVFPKRKPSADPSAPRYLDENLLETPSLALADASRETLRMGDVVEVMLRQVMVALMTNDRALVSEVSRMDNTVDRLDEAIKLYVTKLTRGSLDEHEGRRACGRALRPWLWRTLLPLLLRRSSEVRRKRRDNSRARLLRRFVAIAGWSASILVKSSRRSS
jgi:Na+/phosphate symporter